MTRLSAAPGSDTTSGAESDHSSPCSVTVARDLDEVESLRPATNALKRTPQSDLEGLLAVLRAEPSRARPWVALVRRGCSPVLIAVGRIEQQRSMPCRIGYWTFASFRFRHLSFPPGSIVGDDSEDAARALLTTVRSTLVAGHADAASMDELLLDSWLCRLARSRSSALPRSPVDVGVHWMLSVPRSYEDYLRGRTGRFRKSWRYARNRLRRRYGSGVVVRRYRDPADLDLVLSDLETIAARSYQRSIGAGFANTPAVRAWFLHAMRRGWLRAVVLYLGGRPAAFSWGILHDGVYDACGLAYDADLHRLGPGDFIINREIEAACEDEETLLVDFGYGDDAYKRRYATHTREVATPWLFTTTARGVLLRLARSGSTALNRSLKSAARQTGVFQAVRMRLRRRSVRKLTGMAAPSDINEENDIGQPSKADTWRAVHDP